MGKKKTWTVFVSLVQSLFKLKGSKQKKGSNQVKGLAQICSFDNLQETPKVWKSSGNHFVRIKFKTQQRGFLEVL